MEFINKLKSFRYYNISLKVLLVLLLCIPLFFINVRNDMDWGDDNAHYLLQAKYIVEGTPQANTQYIYNSNYPVLGPSAYPVGFPLMLAGVYYFKGLNLHAFNVFMTLNLLALCLLLVLYYNKKHHFITGTLLILIIAYNPWTLVYKSDIMSEIPFAMILIAAVLLYKRFNNIFSFVLVGLLSACLISVRAIGIVLPLAIMVETAVQLIRTKKEFKRILKKEALKLLIILGFCLSAYLIVNKVLFQIPEDVVNSYTPIFKFSGLWDTVSENFAYYIDIFESFFYPENDSWIFLTLITKSFALTMVLLGFVKKIIKKPEFTDYLVILYMLVLFVYPYSHSGFRFLFPILPFLLGYGVDGLKTIQLGISLKMPAKALLIGLLVLLQYIYGIGEINKTKEIVQEGPCNKESWEIFDYIKKQTPSNAVIAFIKPRALALYTNRNCISNNPDQKDLEIITQKFNDTNVNYYLLYCQKAKEPWSYVLAGMLNAPLEEFIQQSGDKVALIWSNGRFKLYKKQVFTQ